MPKHALVFCRKGFFQPSTVTHISSSWEPTTAALHTSLNLLPRGNVEERLECIRRERQVLGPADPRGQVANEIRRASHSPPASLPRLGSLRISPPLLSPPLSCAPLLPPPAPRSWARVPVGGWSGRAPHASPPPPAAAAAGVPQQGGKLRRLHHRQPRIPRTRTPRTSSAARAADHNLAAHPPNNRATTQPWPTLVSWRRGRACV